MTIDQEFKSQPVASFYKLLGRNFLFIFSCSVFLALLLYFILKFGFASGIGADGYKELQQLFARQPDTPDALANQSKAVQSFLERHQGAIPLFMGMSMFGLALMAYLFCMVLNYTRKYSLGYMLNLKELFLPLKEFIKTFLFMLLLSGFIVFTAGFIAAGYMSSALVGILGIIFLILFIARTVLVIPGMMLGEMGIRESLKYSLQTISVGRAFKITVFGLLIFLVFSLLLSVLLYYPAYWLRTVLPNLYFNLLVTFVQCGMIVTGMSALFFRYGQFEEAGQVSE